MKSLFASKLNLVGVLTILISVGQWFVEQQMIPSEYVAIVGSIIGTLTIVLRTFATDKALTINGKRLS